jgi:hypothetical protein
MFAESSLASGNMIGSSRVSCFPWRAAAECVEGEPAIRRLAHRPAPCPEDRAHDASRLDTGQEWYKIDALID